MLGPYEGGVADICTECFDRFLEQEDAIALS